MIIVVKYAMAAVVTSILPARFPSSAMAGLTNPMIISGIMKLRKWLNIELKVAKRRAIQSGDTKPMAIPSIMAIIILPKRGILNFNFMILSKVVRRC